WQPLRAARIGLRADLRADAHHPFRLWAALCARGLYRVERRGAAWLAHPAGAGGRHRWRRALRRGDLSRALPPVRAAAQLGPGGADRLAWPLHRAAERHRRRLRQRHQGGRTLQRRRDPARRCRLHLGAALSGSGRGRHRRAAGALLEAHRVRQGALGDDRQCRDGAHHRHRHHQGVAARLRARLGDRRGAGRAHPAQGGRHALYGLHRGVHGLRRRGGRRHRLAARRRHRRLRPRHHRESGILEDRHGVAEHDRVRRAVPGAAAEAARSLRPGPPLMDYLLHILVMVSLYAILAASFNLLIGFAGLFALSQAAFFGVGAYATAILATRLGLPFPLPIIAGVLLAAAVGIAVALPALRIGGDHLVVVTLALQIIAIAVMVNWRSLTGGTDGIAGIPKLVFFGVRLDTPGRFLPVALLGAALSLWIGWRLASSP